MKRNKNFIGIDSFKIRVQKVVRSIPKGKVMTYGEVARRAGSPNAYRAVGSIMANNFDKTIPCHRVIKADGSLGNYNLAGGVETKRKLLQKEGYKVR
jgi:O-6-methylguanine DNA methyltransferase